MTKAKDDYADFIVESLSGIGDIRSRAMFGGYGIFHQGLMFALISDGILYFKVDDSNRDGYEKAGSRKFSHGISYWEVPAEVLEDSTRLCQWAKVSVGIAEAKDKKKHRRSC